MMPQPDMSLLDLSNAQGYRPRKVIYTDILSNLRTVMIERMVKPEEVSRTDCYQVNAHTNDKDNLCIIGIGG
jgi:hypothetical protein